MPPFIPHSHLLYKTRTWLWRNLYNRVFAQPAAGALAYAVIVTTQTHESLARHDESCHDRLSETWFPYAPGRQHWAWL